MSVFGLVSLYCVISSEEGMDFFSLRISFWALTNSFLSGVGEG